MKNPMYAAKNATKIPAMTSLMKCTPDMTRTTARIKESIKKKTPIHCQGDTHKNVIAMMVAENTCLLGNDFPFVSFFMIGKTSNTSYGLFLLMRYRLMDNSTKLIAGTKTARIKFSFFCKNKNIIRTGYDTYISPVHNLFAICIPFAIPG